MKIINYLLPILFLSLIKLSGNVNAGIINDWTIAASNPHLSTHSSAHSNSHSSAEVKSAQWQPTSDTNEFDGSGLINTTVNTAGNYLFNWGLTGHYSWYQSSLTLSVLTPLNSMLHTFYDAATSSALDLAGDVIGFKIIGHHYDSSHITKGQLTITHVPEPCALVLLAFIILLIRIIRSNKY